VVLQRVGFKLPETDSHVKNLRKQWQAQEEIDGTPFPKIRVAFGPADVEENWTVPPPMKVEKVDRDNRKLELVGLVPMDAAVKLHAEGTGNKTTITFMDESIGFVSDLSAVPGNTRGVASFTSTEGIENKGSGRDTAVDFRTVFAIAGWDVEEELMEVLLPNSIAAEHERREMLWQFLQQWSDMNHGLSKSQILQLMDQERFLTTLAAELNEAGTHVFRDAWNPLTLPT
jgi:hypothetical protein